jgi:DNA transformation protein
MPDDSGLAEYLLELLEPLGPVRARKMFGGYGIYLEDLMFGLISDSVFYLKVDDGNRPDFVARELPPFTYTYKDGRAMQMSYYQAPAEALESSDEMLAWAQGAYAAAQRSAQNAKPKKRRKA